MSDVIKLSAFADEADKSLEGQISALEENGIPLLEIRGVDGKNVSDITLKEAEEIRKKLDLHGISVWSIGSPFGKIEIKDDFAPHFEKFSKTLEVSNVLGAKRMRIFSFYHTDVPVSCGLFDSVCERLSRFAELSEKHGVILCHENEKGIYGDTAQRCEKIHLSLPDIKSVFDPANFAVCGEDVIKAWETLGKYCEYLHIKDVDAKGETTPPGMGICEIEKLTKLYKGNGGIVATLEPHLPVFDGFSSLEKEGEKTNIVCRYKTQREAFDAAVIAYKNIIKKEIK